MHVAGHAQAATPWLSWLFRPFIHSTSIAAAYGTAVLHPETQCARQARSKLGTSSYSSCSLCVLAFMFISYHSHLFIECTAFIHLHARMHPLPSRIQTGILFQYCSRQTFLSISTMHTRHPAPRLSAYRAALLTFVSPLCPNVTMRLVCYRESIRIPLWAGGAPCRMYVDAGNCNYILGVYL
jgi:hypothetical protein